MHAAILYNSFCAGYCNLSEQIDSYIYNYDDYSCHYFQWLHNY